MKGGQLVDKGSVPLSQPISAFRDVGILAFVLVGQDGIPIISKDAE